MKTMTKDQLATEIVSTYKPCGVSSHSLAYALTQTRTRAELVTLHAEKFPVTIDSPIVATISPVVAVINTPSASINVPLASMHSERLRVQSVCKERLASRQAQRCASMQHTF